jgi:HAMP domain-containing protein
MSSIIAKIRQQEATERIKRVFENLKDGEFEITSPFDAKYNCIAHAAEKNDKWWWSVDKAMMGNDVFWFNNVPSEATLDNFVKAFGKLGYQPCKTDKLEKSFEKVAIFVSTKDEIYAPKGSVTHMARQLSDGKWTSKLGKDVDISHNTLQAIEGKVYGIVKQILKRPK